MHSQNTVFPHPYHEIDPNFTHAHASICSTDLKFQYDTSIGKLNWRAKFQTVNRCRSLSFTLHAQSKYSVSTPLSRNRPQFHTRACFYMFDWPEISVWYFNSQDKLTCKVSDSKSMSKFIFYTTCTVKIQCFYTLWRNRPQFHTRAYFYMFDWPEISVWYFNWQVKLTCKVSDSKSMSKPVCLLHYMHSQNTVFPHPYHDIDPNFTHAHASICSTDLKFQYDTSIGKLNWRAKFQTVNRCRSSSFTLHAQSKYSVSTPLSRNRPQFHTRACFYMLDWPEISVWYFNWQVKLTCKVSESKSLSKFGFYTTCTVKIQCFHTPITKSTPISHTRMLLYVRLTWNFSMILQLAS